MMAVVYRWWGLTIYFFLSSYGWGLWVCGRPWGVTLFSMGGWVGGWVGHSVPGLHNTTTHVHSFARVPYPARGTEHLCPPGPDGTYGKGARRDEKLNPGSPRNGRVSTPTSSFAARPVQCLSCLVGADGILPPLQSNGAECRGWGVA